MWLVAATVLVLSMQAGFLLLEAGRVRSKNAVNVAQKNLSDLIICWCGFSVIGMTLMYGIESPLFADDLNNQSILQFLFQLGLCGAAATLVAGAVSERMSFKAYLMVALITSTVIYPVVGWCVWGSTFNSERFSPLAAIGFQDFAGATVVHSVGAWIALAACLHIGPRIGRFNDDGSVNRIRGHSEVFSLLGTLVLLFGWFGFNAGSLSMTDDRFAQTILNTATAGCFGGLAGMLVGLRFDKGVFNPVRCSNGLLAGLVAITGGVYYASTLQSLVIGAIGGAVAVFCSHYFTHKWKLDDSVDVFAVHGVPGIFGTLAVAALLPGQLLVAGSRILQLLVQSVGVVVVAAISFAVTWVFLNQLKRSMPLRVSAEDESLGLNHTVHGVSLNGERLKQMIDEKIDGDNNVSVYSQIIVDEGDESTELAESMNKLLLVHEQARVQILTEQQRFEQFAVIASDFWWETDEKLDLNFMTESYSSGVTSAPSNLKGLALLDVFKCDPVEEKKCRLAIADRNPLNRVVGELDLGGDSSVRIIEFNAMPYFDSAGGFQGYRGTATDITERQASKERDIFLSNHDELTGLRNRRAFGSALSVEMVPVDGVINALAVAAIDLDGFKAVNDNYGHDIGDLLLQEFSERVVSELRPGDDLFRMGGDEFIILLRNLDDKNVVDEACRWCEKLKDIATEPFELNSIVIEIGTSIGLSFFPADTDSSDDLLRMADLALYEAKRSGKGCVVTFKKEMDEEANTKREMESDIHNAIRRNEFILCYQPKYSVARHTVVGFEALARWNHPKRGTINPEDFIPALEKFDLITTFSEFVLLEACRFGSSWTPEDGMHVSVNVSPVDLANDDFVSILSSIIETASIDPSFLEIEITEQALIADMTKTEAVLNEIRQLGVSIALDDFGSGNTSLRYIQQLPVSKVKIDRCFIAELTHNDKAKEITRSIIDDCQKLGIVVTAEGVENQAQLSLLQQWGCNELQGFMFSHALTLTQANDYINDQHLDETG